MHHVSFHLSIFSEFSSVNVFYFSLKRVSFLQLSFCYIFAVSIVFLNYFLDNIFKEEATDLHCLPIPVPPYLGSYSAGFSKIVATCQHVVLMRIGA